MGERAIQNRIRRLQELDRQQAEIEAEREKLKDEIKKDMQKKGIDQVKAGNFIVRCKKIISNRFDSKRFRADHEDLYKSYQKKTGSNEIFRYGNECIGLTQEPNKKGEWIDENIKYKR